MNKLDNFTHVNVLKNVSKLTAKIMEIGINYSSSNNGDNNLYSKYYVNASILSELAMNNIILRYWGVWL